MARSFDQLLSLTGSEARAAVLVQALQGTPDPEGKRELLAEWFNLCDALAPQREELREQCRLAGFFTDSPDVDLDFPVTVYRAAWSDDEVGKALSWTTEREVAERFARILTGPRGWFLGLDRQDDVEMYIWQGECQAAFGYLNGREEREIVASVVVDIEPIAALRTVHTGDV